jgi:hypothetical protein
VGRQSDHDITIVGCGQMYRSAGMKVGAMRRPGYVEARYEVDRLLSSSLVLFS